jgi:DNA adenine methylase
MSKLEKEIPIGAKPFLRWAGSKKAQLARLSGFWSDGFDRYVEPFAGSASLFFRLAPRSALICDLNVQLIELYEVVRDTPQELYENLVSIKRNRHTYLKIRSADPSRLAKFDRAVRFLYLNRNCFNGIYRTNLRGHFNVPMGSRVGAYCSIEELIKCSEALHKAELRASDFGDIIGEIKNNYFVYMDPPYRVSTRRVFFEYGDKVFSTHDVDRLAESLQEIHKRRAYFVLQYADCPRAREIAKSWNSVRLPVKRSISGFINSRRTAYEWTISNLAFPKP